MAFALWNSSAKLLYQPIVNLPLKSKHLRKFQFGFSLGCVVLEAPLQGEGLLDVPMKLLLEPKIVLFMKKRVLETKKILENSNACLPPASELISLDTISIFSRHSDITTDI